jgi:hypothetical protein
MRIISRKIHAVMDYIVGILLIAAPWIFGFSDIPAAKWTAIVVGVLLLLMSAVTDYEGGGVKMLPMRIHLIMDVIAGVFLAASPWLFHFSDDVYLPHLIVGILEIGAGLMTERSSQAKTAHVEGGMRRAL